MLDAGARMRNAFEGLDCLCEDRPPVPALSDRSNSLISRRVAPSVVCTTAMLL